MKRRTVGQHGAARVLGQAHIDIVLDLPQLHDFRIFVDLLFDRGHLVRIGFNLGIERVVLLRRGLPFERCALKILQQFLQFHVLYADLVHGTGEPGGIQVGLQIGNIAVDQLDLVFLRDPLLFEVLIQAVLAIAVLFLLVLDVLVDDGLNDHFAGIWIAVGHANVNQARIGRRRHVQLVDEILLGILNRAGKALKPQCRAHIGVRILQHLGDQQRILQHAGM